MTVTTIDAEHKPDDPDATAVDEGLGAITTAAELLMWVASLADVPVDTPCSIDVETKITTVVITLDTDSAMRSWARSVGATPTTTDDELGPLLRATADIGAWRIVLVYAPGRP